MNTATNASNILSKYALSQSKVKLWETTACKRKWQAEVRGEMVFEPNEHMMKGSFFETICLGSGVRGQVTTDLPRLKTGAKSMDQIRIEAQAARFKLLFNPDSPEYMGWQMTDSQVFIEKDGREGTLDFVCRRDGVKSIWDLKLTGDLANPGGWWGKPEEMDHLQLGFYKYLYREKFGEDCETYYALFDYSTSQRCKIIKLNISEESMAGYLLRFDDVEGTLLELDQLEEYPRIPSYNECVKCKLQCSQRAITPGIDFIELTI